MNVCTAYLCFLMMHIILQTILKIIVIVKFIILIVDSLSLSPPLPLFLSLSLSLSLYHTHKHTHAHTRIHTHNLQLSYFPPLPSPVYFCKCFVHAFYKPSHFIFNSHVPKTKIIFLFIHFIIYLLTYDNSS